MDRMKSSEFRKRYASLREQTVVTVSGHPIGVWVPKSPAFDMTPDGTGIDFPVVDGLAVLPDGRRIASPSQVLRVPLVDRYDQRPIRPVPKRK